MTSLQSTLIAICLAGAVLIGLAPSAEAQWQPLGGPPGNTIVGAPTCMSITTGASTRVECYVSGSDGGIWRRSSPNGEDWSGAWQSLAGAPLFDAPDCVWWLPFGADRIDCFVVFTDRALWQRTSLDGGASWQPWLRRGGDLFAPPSCVIWRQQQINCYGLFNDGSIRLASQDGANTVNWHDWVSLGAGFNAGPHCGGWMNGATDTIDCFVRNMSGVWTTMSRTAHPVVTPPPVWSPIPTLGSPLIAFNCRGAYPRAKLECYGYAPTLAVGANTNSLVQFSTDRTPRWTRFTAETPRTDTPANRLFTPSCVGMGSDIACFTVVRSSDAQTENHFQLWANMLDSDPPARNLGGDLTSAPSCVTMPDNVRVQCFARGTDGNLWRIIVANETTRIAPFPQPDRTPLGRCLPGRPCQ